MGPVHVPYGSNLSVGEDSLPRLLRTTDDSNLEGDYGGRRQQPHIDRVVERSLENGCESSGANFAAVVGVSLERLEYSVVFNIAELRVPQCRLILFGSVEIAFQDVRALVPGTQAAGIILTQKHPQCHSMSSSF